MIVICGKTCSGKTTIVNQLIQNYGFHKLITYTTRPIRKNEINGLDYHFITVEDFLVKYINGFFLEVNFYNALINGERRIVFYGSAKEDYDKINDDDNDNTVVIITPNKINELKKYVKNLKIIYIYCDEQELRNRLIKRGDNELEINRRLQSDNADFKDVDKIYDYCFDNLSNNIDNIYNISNKIYEINKNGG